MLKPFQMYRKLTNCHCNLQNKPRISPWDGTFKSHRLCNPKSPWYSELVPINDIVPAEFLEGQGEFMAFIM